MKAHNLKPGHVLVDPDGHLYEVRAVDRVEGDIFAWLWPDSSPVPNYFQQFESDDDIVSINHNPNEETAVIPRVEEAPDELVTDGTAE